MTETEAKWAERVRAWRASVKTAEVFASGQEFEASTLRYWSSRLKAELVDAKASVKPASTTVAMARVLRGRRRQPEGVHVATGAELAIVIGGAKISVSRGFDAALLREVVVALGGGE